MLIATRGSSVLSITASCCDEEPGMTGKWYDPNHINLVLILPRDIDSAGAMIRFYFKQEIK